MEMPPVVVDDDPPVELVPPPVLLPPVLEPVVWAPVLEEDAPAVEEAAALDEPLRCWPFTIGSLGVKSQAATPRATPSAAP